MVDPAAFSNKAVGHKKSVTPANAVVSEVAGVA
jgi:hypothetical protein